MHPRYATLYLVRHGETDWNKQKIIQGQKDIPLNADGELQAQEVATLLKDIHIDAIFASDLVRAKRTAEVIALERKMAVVTKELLREQHYGRFEGRPREELLKLFTTWKTLSEEEKFHHTVGDEESNFQALSRLLTVLREIGAAYAGKHVVVVCHGALLRYLLIKVGKATFDKPIFIRNAGYIKLRTDGVEFFVDEIVGTEEPHYRND